MVKSLIFSFAIVALSVASAETYKVSFAEPSVVKGQTLKAGEYKLDVKDNSVVILDGKKQLEVPVKVESAGKTFNRTRVLYNADKGKYTIQEIEIGGTKTKLTFDSGVQMGGGE